MHGETTAMDIVRLALQATVAITAHQKSSSRGKNGYGCKLARTPCSSASWGGWPLGFSIFMATTSAVSRLVAMLTSLKVPCPMRSPTSQVLATTVPACGRARGDGEVQQLQASYAVSLRGS